MRRVVLRPTVVIAFHSVDVYRNLEVRPEALTYLQSTDASEGKEPRKGCWVGNLIHVNTVSLDNYFNQRRATPCICKNDPFPSNSSIALNMPYDHQHWEDHLSWDLGLHLIIYKVAVTVEFDIHAYFICFFA
ncbi:hypothetical protein AV530_011780 [Patagioenas fasciata monilis]|uniref:Uncharacterized protein n=1 Tax=Patagioenas fasciata monilis TaxID=372326 RepID=A0A1V4KLL6_PATFA|nr:hypothetical protein AV530_011780 [Patagioenas fasciata monilis]